MLAGLCYNFHLLFGGHSTKQTPTPNACSGIAVARGTCNIARGMLVNWPQQCSLLITVIVAPFGLICIRIGPTLRAEGAGVLRMRTAQAVQAGRMAHATGRRPQAAYAPPAVVISITVELQCPLRQLRIRWKVWAAASTFPLSFLEQPAMKFM